jgi:hypothetical protein
MECSRALRLMYDNIDGILDKPGQEELADHLESCGHCVREYDDILNLHSFYKARALDEPQMDLAASVVAKIQIKTPQLARRRRLRAGSDNVGLFVQAAMASALIYVLAPYLFGSQPLSKGFRFAWQILAFDITFFSSLSLPEVAVFIPGLTRAVETVATFGQVLADLQPNLLVSVAALLLLQAVGNHLLFSSIQRRGR